MLRRPAAVMLALLGALPLPHARAAGLPAISPAQHALVDTACTTTMGLRPGETYYAACREILARSLEAEAENRALAAAYEECGRLGMASGTPAFSACVLDKEDERQATSAVTPEVAASVSATATPDTSFYDMSPSLRWNSERRACAQLGLLPGSESFRQCVGALHGALLPSQN